MPIRVRLALSFAVATLLLIGVGGLLFLESFRSGLEDSLGPGLRARAGVLAQRVRESGAVAALEDAEGGSARGRDVVEQVLDQRGRVLATTSEAGDRAVIEPSVVDQADRAPAYTNTVVGGEREPFRVLAFPVATTAGRRIVVVATSLEATEEAVARVRDALLFGGAGAVLLAGLGGWLLAAASLHPVERMRRQAAEISEHDAASRLSVPGTRDEISALATTMNDLLARLHDSWRRQGAFVADAGHELRTPLAVLRTELELADRPQRTEQELREAIQHTSRGVDRLAHLTEDLLLLARTEGAAEPRLEWVHLGELIADAVGATGEQAGGSDVRIVVDGPAALDVRGVRSLLRRALDNLLENAVRYSPRGATVTLRTSVVGDEVVIAVLDEGPGFTPGFLPHAFERFRRADDARSRGDGGTGLGLAIVLAVAEAHGGTAAAANRPEGGAIVTVTIPHRRSARTSKEM